MFKRLATRMVIGSTAVVSAAIGANLITAGPVAALSDGSSSAAVLSDVAGSWKAYGDINPIDSSSSKWSCGGTDTVDTLVIAQACAVRSSNGRYAQAAVIVRNNRSTSYAAEVAMELWGDDGRFGRWTCSRSGVARNSWSVCFGSTLPITDKVLVDPAGVNGQSIDSSREV
jgi:hypothetical protein